MHNQWWSVHINGELVSGIFSPDALKSIIQNRLNDNVAIPPGHRGAIFVYTGTDSVQAGVAFKTDSGWQIQGDVNFIPHTGNLSAGLNVLKTW